MPSKFDEQMHIGYIAVFRHHNHPRLSVLVDNHRRGSGYFLFKMGNFKLLNLFKPAQRIIPDVPAPQERRVPFKYV